MIMVILKNEFAQLALLNTTEVCSQLHHLDWDGQLFVFPGGNSHRVRTAKE